MPGTVEFLGVQHRFADFCLSRGSWEYENGPYIQRFPLPGISLTFIPDANWPIGSGPVIAITDDGTVECGDWDSRGGSVLTRNEMIVPPFQSLTNSPDSECRQ